MPPVSSAGLASPSSSSPLETRRTAEGPSSLCRATRHGLGWCMSSYTHIPQQSVCILHMTDAHGLVSDTQRIRMLLISSNDVVLCVHATDGCHGTYTHRLTSSFGEFIVMPPNDSTGKIRPAGRVNAMYTPEWCTIHTRHVSRRITKVV